MSVKYTNTVSQIDPSGFLRNKDLIQKALENPLAPPPCNIKYVIILITISKEKYTSPDIEL